jgi:hypothetical protein
MANLIPEEYKLIRRLRRLRGEVEDILDTAGLQRDERSHLAQVEHLLVATISGLTMRQPVEASQ